MSKMSKTPFELKDTVSELISNLELLFHDRGERGDLITIKFFYKRLHPQTVMNNVIDRMLPFSNQIKERDINFFKDNTTIFESLPKDRVQYYKNKILGFDKEDLDVIWEYLDAMVAHAEIYIDENKGS